MIIVWLKNASTTLATQLDHIAKENPTAAIEQGEIIIKQVEQLAIHPEIGRVGRKQGTRELVISRTSFIVIYRVKPAVNRVEILRVLHSSQQWPTV